LDLLTEYEAKSTKQLVKMKEEVFLKTRDESQKDRGKAEQVNIYDEKFAGTTGMFDALDGKIALTVEDKFEEDEDEGGENAERGAEAEDADDEKEGSSDAGGGAADGNDEEE
jgi:hypothetical protein